ncbi:hypothetical protein FGO68_gene16900 [Halteria grandinella]|uniref:Palmitoyltransferase n=1 Tax=Halteria grandinella TaxID=5974 RepID=A0A8J8T8I2_HALGN|nr:hypothetical protein FGO68_gene16900 [Halteria grandinella]
MTTPAAFQGWEQPWLARTKILLQGRLMLGPPEYRWLVYTMVFAIVSCLYSVIEASKYFFIPQATIDSHEIQTTSTRLEHIKLYPHDNCTKVCTPHALLYYGIIISGLLSLYNYLMCSLRDPGVILRHKDSRRLKSERKEKKLHQKLTQTSTVSTTESITAADQLSTSSSEEEEEENADEESKEQANQLASIYKRRFCKTCFIYRPPLSSHCRHCDQCVSNFDHHCFLVNSCVGRRNMRNFVLFTHFICIMCLLFCYAYITVIRQHLLLRDMDNYQANYDTINLLDYATLLIMVLSETMMPKLRPLTTLYALIAIYYQSTLLSVFATWDSLYVLYFTCASFGLGTSLGYVREYLTLTYLGFTKKELRSVEWEMERKVKCVGVQRGLGNMYRFYVMNSNDPGRGESELTKQVANLN